MSGFRDSFTKEDTKEDLLGYDDTAFNYFAITILSCLATPWTLSLLCRALLLAVGRAEAEFPKKSNAGHIVRYCGTADMVDKIDVARRRAARWTRGSVCWWSTKLAVLAIVWICVFGTVRHLRRSGQKEIRRFDPFELLDVHPDASNVEVRRAYRKWSLLYHPDKNPDDPLAASRFIQITKAYAALTDEVAMRNWEKYGNPDGPQTTKVGIGLPRLLLEKEHYFIILCSFFLVIIIVVPVSFICYYNRTKNFATNGVLIETLQFLGVYVTEFARINRCPEVFAACAESRNLPVRPTDNAQIQSLAGQVIEHKKRSFTLPVVMKNQYLVWAHMQRRHNLMSPELKKDCDELLGHSIKVTQAMIEIACMREWFTTAQSMIEFRRCLVQALDIGSSELLQIPHFTEENRNKCGSEKNLVNTLAEFLSLDTARRKPLLQWMSAQQRADVDAFLAHVGEVDLRAEVAVEDEAEIVVGDVATVSVQLLRRHLHPGEETGPAHAPFFPEPRNEEWWLFLVEEGDRERIVHFERVCSPERCIQQDLRFQIARPGQHTLVLHALCDSYAGLDRRIELSFEAKPEAEGRREFHVHEEDADLDLQPSIFQQWMGDLRHQDESDEEEEEEEGEVGDECKNAAGRGGRGGKAPPQRPSASQAAGGERRTEPEPTESGREGSSSGSDDD